MYPRYLIIAAVVIALSGSGFAGISAATDENTLEIIINGDTVQISIVGKSGNIETVKLTENDLRSKYAFTDDSALSPIEIKNELLIDGDRIVIDGKIFSQGEIDNLLVSGTPDNGFSFKAKLPYRDYELSRHKVISASKHNADDRVSFNDLVIGADEVVYGDAVSITGNVTVHGRVMGDIVSVFGDVVLCEGSFAGGDIAAPFGEIINQGTAVIKGEVFPRKTWQRKVSKTDFDIDARYNRVEGFTLLTGIHYRNETKELPDIVLTAGYAFSLKRWDYNIGFRQELGDILAFYFGGNLYQGAVTPDDWLFTKHENTIASLFFKEDFHDFYFRKGIRGFLGQKPSQTAFAQVEYTKESHESLLKTTNSAIFGGKKNFRENFSVAGSDQALLENIDGDLEMFGLRLGWDSRNSETWATAGEFIELLWESAGDGIIGNLGGDFSYDIVQATLAHYQRVTPKQHFGIRLKGGYSDQDLPLDRWLFLGGVGSLRGYDYKEFSGNRYMLANFDYYFEFSNDFSVALFADAGKTGFGKRAFNDANLKTDIGAGVIFNDDIRIDLAQRLDDADEGPVVMARFNVHF
jgi:hypothetical protein